jgi:hypothetical protein
MYAESTVGVQKVGDIKVDLRGTDMSRFQNRWMMRKDKRVYNIQYELQVKFGQREGVLVVEAKHGKSVVGLAQIEYASE